MAINMEVTECIWGVEGEGYVFLRVNFVICTTFQECFTIRMNVPIALEVISDELHNFSAAFFKLLNTIGFPSSLMYIEKLDIKILVC